MFNGLSRTTRINDTGYTMRYGGVVVAFDQAGCVKNIEPQWYMFSSPLIILN